MPALPRLLRHLLIATIVPGMWLAVQAQPVLREQEAKAAYLYNFLEFGQWPPGQHAGAPKALCVAGEDPLQGALDEIARRSLPDREIRVAYGRKEGNLRDCQLLYVPAPLRAHLDAFVRAASDSPVLVVTDAEDTLARGVMIELRPLDRRLGFAVNVATLRRANIRLPASVLRLAIEVRE